MSLHGFCKSKTSCFTCYGDWKRLCLSAFQKDFVAVLEGGTFEKAPPILTISVIMDYAEKWCFCFFLKTFLERLTILPFCQEA